jgi:hypothetical protein
MVVDPSFSTKIKGIIDPSIFSIFKLAIKGMD